MFPAKAPESVGYPTHFFQKNWYVCDEEVTSDVLRVLSGVDTPEDINKTFIVLLPKVQVHLLWVSIGK
jgi:hypothetical protein